MNMEMHTTGGLVRRFVSGPAPQELLFSAAAAGQPDAGDDDGANHVPASSLWLAIYLPSLSLEVFARGMENDVPLAVSNGTSRVPVILHCNRCAGQAGVSSGMTVSAALALVGHLQVLPRDEKLELDALERIAAWAGQFTSLVSLAAPRGLLLDIAGSLRLFGGMEALCQQIGDGLQALGYQASLGVTPTPLGALLLAQCGKENRIVDRASLSSVLARLPLSQLGLETRTLKRLQGMGLRIIRDLLRLPRKELAQRTGPPFVDMLDRVLGEQPDPRLPWQPPPRFDSHLMLPAEVTTTMALLFPARRLLQELAGVLRARCAGVMRVDWQLTHHDQPATRFSLGLLRLSRDADYLLGLLEEQLERLQLPAAVEAITLTVEQMSPLSLPGADLFAAGNAEQEGDGLLFLERLRNRLGVDAISGMCLAPEHRPERAWQVCEPEQNPAGKQSEGILPAGQRPVWLLDMPVVLGVVDGKPYMEGVLMLQPVRERIETGWWDRQGIRRDYFVASNSRGGCFWIFRELQGKERWFLHGIAG